VIIKESTEVSGLNHFSFTKQESMTWQIPSIVIDVSAIFVATTTYKKIEVFAKRKTSQWHKSVLLFYALSLMA
jgi:hypothetical protein